MNPVRILFIALGFIFFGLGALGVVLPILPTTPFLLLASFFFAKGSERFNNWFISTKLYNDYLDSYVKHRSMTRKTKIKILALATTMLVISLIAVPVIYARIFIAAVIAFMYYYFAFRIKTITPEELAAQKAADKAAREQAEQEAITLRETLGEVREMHEEMLEDMPEPQVSTLP